MKKNETNFPAERKIIADYPFGIFNIELTNSCPMKCIMCPRTYHMTREQGFMDIRLFKKIIDELAEVNESFLDDRVVWLHHFGESLLHPEFDSFIRYAAEKHIRTGLSVNPMMLDEKRALSLVSSGLHILYLSLDGHDNDSFFKIRGVKNMYENSRRRMVNFLKLKKENSCDMKILLSMIDFPLNSKSVDEVRDEWKSCEGIDEFLLKRFTSWDGSVSEIEDLAPVSSAEVEDDYSSASCSFPWSNMTVTWDGDVVPCCFDYNKKIVLGNALTHTLSYIWNDTPMQEFRKEFIDNNVTNSLCSRCENLYPQTAIL